MIPGVNAPPMHPWCRSTTVPHVGNWRDKFFKERKGKYQVENKTSEKEKLQEKAKKEMLEMISNGKIKVEINPEKQNRHNKNHHLFIKSKRQAISSNYMLPSYTIISNRKLNELLKEKVGTGEFLILKDKFNQKEIIDFEIVIGKSFVNGQYLDTTFGKVHYSKTGTHVVPYVKKEVE
ncbi:phage capsid protein [Staphylococcus warneri]|uniref:polymorphic toxin type 50 domain-containing protein n=3 Tax=Staphylococcus warneri TaxID=1292 RepID=UPI000D1F54C3|nr:polymorphic toxin type 50 domain-containing protein [Staphylococcus warneri]AXV42506.1 putative phage head morphogenesis protein [Staphylococcus sp. M0911]MCD8803583.1 phage capsid protein [Staphylococcus warneri]MCD8806003.1 phage capsid protein [Staphylococcus warneri]PTI16503.1 phage capsid protein [Staphylococcus warneri]RIN01319.1 phage capsid protein [Staphylococcus warneri]